MVFLCPDRKVRKPECADSRQVTWLLLCFCYKAGGKWGEEMHTLAFRLRLQLFLPPHAVHIHRVANLG